MMPIKGRFYNTDLFGVVQIVGTDVTGKVLIEATERKTGRPEWPQTINAGYRDWVSSYAIGPEVTRADRAGGAGE